MKSFEPLSDYRFFMAPSAWTDTDDGSTRTPLNGIAVEIIKIGQRRYQPIANGPNRYVSFEKPCQCNTLEEAKKYAWACFKGLFPLVPSASIPFVWMSEQRRSQINAGPLRLGA